MSPRRLSVHGVVGSTVPRAPQQDITSSVGTPPASVLIVQKTRVSEARLKDCQSWLLRRTQSSRPSGLAVPWNFSIRPVTHHTYATGSVGRLEVTQNYDVERGLLRKYIFLIFTLTSCQFFFSSLLSLAAAGTIYAPQTALITGHLIIKLHMPPPFFSLFVLYFWILLLSLFFFFFLISEIIGRKCRENILYCGRKWKYTILWWRSAENPTHCRIQLSLNSHLYKAVLSTQIYIWCIVSYGPSRTSAHPLSLSLYNCFPFLSSLSLSLFPSFCISMSSGDGGGWEERRYGMGG